MKDSASLKKVLAGDGDWAMIKEILVWVIDAHQDNLDMSSKVRLELISLLETQ